MDQLVTIGDLGGFEVTTAAQTCDVEMIRGLQVNTIKVNPCLPGGYIFQNYSLS